ncbi:Solute carrier family 12 member 5 [Toxocara canis]|uniref:Solute carrier family 12 member 5 n=1 Tax=Toxocara canis TaxID=6265 RepID=A0A0B2VBC0_TOXCA|nr:Solute carrier family 12 member 5 [Toxocara canis]
MVEVRPFDVETTLTDVTTFDDTDDLLGDGFTSLTPRATVNLFGSEQDCEGVRHLMFIASALLLLCYKSTTLLLLANCGFTAANCMLCAEMITRYVSYNRLVNSAQTHQLLRNNLTVLRALELDTESDGLLLFYFYVFLVIPMIYAGIGKRVVKYFFWVPIIFFEISLGAIIASIVYLKWNEDYETRCVLGEKCLIVERRSSFFNRIVACSPLKEICHEVPLDLKTITWSFEMAVSNFDINIASLAHLRANDWRSIVYQSRIFNNIIVPNVHVASLFGCVVMMLPLFTGTVLGANIPSALAAPTKKIAKGVLSAILSLFALVIILGTLIACGIERDLLVDKFGEGSIRRLSLPLTVASPLFIIVTIAAVSTAAAGQYMLTSKSLLLSLITSRKFAVPYFFFYRKNKLRHTTAMLLIAVVVAMFAAFGSVDDILIVSGCTMLGALSLVNFSAAFCSAFDFPSWKPATCMFFWPVALLGAFACWLTAFVTKATVVSPLTVCSWFYYLASNIFSRRHPMRAHEEFFLGFANMLLYTIPLGEFRQISFIVPFSQQIAVG